MHKIEGEQRADKRVLLEYQNGVGCMQCLLSVRGHL